MKILLAVMISAGIWLWLLRRYDRLKPEPLRVLIRVMIVGGCFSALLAGVCNSTFMAWSGFSPEGEMTRFQVMLLSLFVGFNEEGWKAFFALWLVKQIAEFDEPIDGSIYAMTVALGFAAVENVSYLYQYGLGLIVVRSVLAVPAHMIFAGYWGYGLSKVYFVKGKTDRLFLRVFPYIAIAALLHALYDFLAMQSGSLTAYVFPLVLLLGFITHRRLVRMREEALAAEKSRLTWPDLEE